MNISIDNISNLRGWFLPLAGILTLLLMIAIFYGPAILEKVRVIKLLPKRFIDLFDGWMENSQWLRNPRQVFPGVLLTIVIWGVMWSTNLLLFRSFGFALGGTAAGLVLVTVYVGLFPALMPGNVGPFYFFAQLSLVPFGIIHDQAVAFAIVLHAIVTLPPLLGGALGLLIRPKHVVIP